jgi:hypothetical protein
MRILTENLYGYRKILFPETPQKRVLVHVLFWTFFILYHLLFFIPAFNDRIKDKQLIWVNILYYGRYIPIFYLMRVLYLGFAKSLKGGALFVTLLMSALIVEHLVTVLLYKYLQASIGLDHLPGNFPVLGRLYLTPLFAKDGKDWLVLIYDLLEMQLLILPVGIKMIKYGVIHDIEEITKEKGKIQSELDYLRAQLTPHFIFNLLNSVHAEIKSISRSAAGYVAQAADLIRFALYETGQEFISLHSELHYIELYVELETMRTAQRSEISFVKKGNAYQEYEVPTLMLITLVENAFKHSVHASPEHSCIDIASEVSGECLYFEVTNSKPVSRHLKPGDDKKQNGIGLVNLRRTLQLHFPLTHRLSIRESDTQFSIRLQIPLSRKAPT